MGEFPEHEALQAAAASMKVCRAVLRRAAGAGPRRPREEVPRSGCSATGAVIVTGMPEASMRSLGRPGAATSTSAPLHRAGVVGERVGRVKELPGRKGGAGESQERTRTDRNGMRNGSSCAMNPVWRRRRNEWRHIGVRSRRRRELSGKACLLVRGRGSFCPTGGVTEEKPAAGARTPRDAGPSCEVRVSVRRERCSRPSGPSGSARCQR